MCFTKDVLPTRWLDLFNWKLILKWSTTRPPCGKWSHYCDNLRNASSRSSSVTAAWTTVSDWWNLPGGRIVTIFPDRSPLASGRRMKRMRPFAPFPGVRITNARTFCPSPDSTWGDNRIHWWPCGLPSMDTRIWPEPIDSGLANSNAPDSFRAWR